MNKFKEWEQKHALKILGVCGGLIIVFYFWFLNSGESLADATSVEEGKIAVDYFINGWDEQYQELCGGPRNGTTKEEFAELGEIIRSINEAGEKCEKLDYKLQMEVQNYADEKIKKFPHLEHLAYQASIDCW